MSGLSGDAFVRRGEAIHSKAEFAVFAELLLRNYREHPEEWENNTLEQFLDGLEGFARDMEGYYFNKGVEQDLDRPSWRVFADILLAARVYE